MNITEHKEGRGRGGERVRDGASMDNTGRLGSKFKNVSLNLIMVAGVFGFIPVSQYNFFKGRV